MRLDGDRRSGHRRGGIAPEVKIVLRVAWTRRYARAELGARSIPAAKRLLLRRIGNAGCQQERAGAARKLDIGLDETGGRGTAWIHVPGEAKVERGDMFFPLWRVDATSSLRPVLGLRPNPGELIV